MIIKGAETFSLSKSQRRKLDITAKAAMNSSCRSKHAASIWKANCILSLGINTSRLNNSYVNWTEDCPVPSEHSEIAAIRMCGNVDLTGAVLYVARVNKAGKEMMSRPCANCHKAIVKAGIRKVVYTV